MIVLLGRFDLLKVVEIFFVCFELFELVFKLKVIELFMIWWEWSLWFVSSIGDEGILVNVVNIN